MTARRSAETTLARVQRRLRALALGAICLVLPQMAGFCLVESEGGEIRVESEVVVRSDQGADESREFSRTAYLPREPRGCGACRRSGGKCATVGHSLPGGLRAPLTC